jgi:hypothetical protein
MAETDEAMVEAHVMINFVPTRGARILGFGTAVPEPARRSAMTDLLAAEPNPAIGLRVVRRDTQRTGSNELLAAWMACQNEPTLNGYRDFQLRPPWPNLLCAAPTLLSSQVVPWSF